MQFAEKRLIPAILGSSIADIVEYGFAMIMLDLVGLNVHTASDTHLNRWKGSHHRVPIHLECGGFTPSGTPDDTGCFHDTFFGEVSWNIHPKRKNE